MRSDVSLRDQARDYESYASPEFRSVFGGIRIADDLIGHAVHDIGIIERNSGVVVAGFAASVIGSEMNGIVRLVKARNIHGILKAVNIFAGLLIFEERISACGCAENSVDVISVPPYPRERTVRFEIEFVESVKAATAASAVTMIFLTLDIYASCLLIGRSARPHFYFITTSSD